MPRIVACGPRRDAFDSFAKNSADDAPMLLVDAERRVTAANPWQHLAASDGWSRPDWATDEQCHLMVEVMEAWFLTDRESLASFYGQHFQASALPGNSNVEQITKTDVLVGIADATRTTQKGTYDKGSHSFDILATLDPLRVESAAPHAKRFLDALRS